ncbi:Gfo/Idh/MocA family oxidoreductase [Actinoplanes bogorensis]|uniref:Gfo/Idh/MocA family oxidoreductase n=1 Tax=Paractinoplanes bogorensis TaxID=1610840 RepID=A0ABS5Z3D1_9ACTN|nr:Gfo/Idh/MocA family oxidoreductase [Actinoplanes bogorensis]MBU2670197.1 Gfo/Idh/MocA family oxidoreductase [Actinoplanes bogorensis]
MTARVAVVGAAGWAGSRQLNAFAEVGAEIVAVVDPAISSTTIDELDPAGVDLVVVALPTRAQPAVCAGLLGRGFRVLCEKPVAADPVQARELASVPGAADRLMIGYMLREHPAFEILRDWVSTVDVEAASIRTVARKTEVGSWRADPREGGVVVVNAVHALEIVGALIPGEPSVLDVRSSSGLYGSSVPEMVHAAYRIGDGPLVRLEAYWSPWDNAEGLNDGDWDLSVDLIARQGRRYWHNWTIEAWDRDGDREVRTLPEEDLFVRQARTALKFAAGGRPSVDVEAALRPTELAAAINGELETSA